MTNSNPNSDFRNLPFLLRQGYSGQVGPKPVFRADSKHLFGVGARMAQSTPLLPSSSHCSSVQERLVNYGSEALDTVEHLGLIIKDQNKAAALFEHFGSLDQLARASVQELLPFLSPAKAAQLVSSLRLAAVALREERRR